MQRVQTALTPGAGSRGVNLTNQLHLEPRLRMNGSIHLLLLFALNSCVPSWCGQFTLHFINKCFTLFGQYYLVVLVNQLQSNTHHTNPTSEQRTFFYYYYFSMPYFGSLFDRSLVQNTGT